MKRVFALLLAALMLLSLCACGEKDSAEDTKPTENVQTPTEGKTQDTQPSNNEGQAGDTTPAETTPAETQPVETQPAPTGCSHTNWKDATCTAPKTCSNCGFTEGEALGHNFMGDTCLDCNAPNPNVAFDETFWTLDVLSGPQLNRISFEVTKGMGYMNVSFWSQNPGYGEPFKFNGKDYYDDGFGKSAEIMGYEERGVVQLKVSSYEYETEGTITLKRTDVDKFTVTAVSGTIISDSITSAITVGSVFGLYKGY